MHTKSLFFLPLVIRIIWSPWKAWEPTRSHEEDSNFLRPGSIGHFVLEIQSLKSRSSHQRRSREAKRLSYQKSEHWNRPHQEGGEVEELVLDHIEELWLVNQAIPGSWTNQANIIKTYISTTLTYKKVLHSLFIRPEVLEGSKYSVPDLGNMIYSRKTQNVHKSHRKESTVVLVQTISVWPMVHLRFRKC